MRKIQISPIALAALAAVFLVYLLFSARAHAAGSGAESVPLYNNLGNYQVPVTTGKARAQQYFDQGMRLYYAFNHAEAIRAFRAAQRLDPNCAMCWWGEALAWGPNINLPMDQPSALAAHRAVQLALVKKPSVSNLEQAMIEALALRYAADAPEPRGHLDRAYADAMAELAADYPDNAEVAVLYAEALMDLRPWDYWTAEGRPQPGMEVALEKLQQVIAQNDSHPGACHFYIHAVESVYPERAVPCAERLARLMPGAGHLVHMPGHIYIRVGRYMDAVDANQHAVHADETYIQDQRPGMGMYTAGYYPHNYDFMAFAAMMIGRSVLAVESAEKVTSLLPEALFGSPGMDFLQNLLVRPLQMHVRFAQWNEILAASKPSEIYPHSLGIWHYARGRALLAIGKPEAAKQELRDLRAVAQSEDLSGLRMEFNQSSSLLSIADKVLSGWYQASADNFDAAISILRAANREEDELFYGEPPEWSVPTRQDLGAVLLAAGRPVEAEQAFREDLAKFPENVWSLYGVAEALKQQGNMEAAAAFEATLRRVAASADIELANIFKSK